MRKYLFLVAVLVIGLMALGAPAMAGHEESCAGNPGDPTSTGVVYADANGDGNSGHVTVGSCDGTAPDGHVTVAGSLSGECAYVVADGDPSNGSDADGHVGAELGSGGATPVGPAEGDYAPTCSHV